MKKALLLLVIVIGFTSCAQDKRPIAGDTEFQRKLNSEFRDASKSPLKDKDRKNFKGLDFFPFDSSYVVTATFTKLEGEQPFKMKTTTDRTPAYVKYGTISFQLKGEPFQLTVYQNLEIVNDAGFEDYLFLPFLDDTNGDSSYGGGRYIDLRFPKGDTMVIDFNTAYNPYCVYNEIYSCPIVPRDNYVATTVEAGVKAFVKN